MVWFFQCFGLLVRHFYWFFQCSGLLVRHFYWLFQCFGLLMCHFYWFFQCFGIPACTFYWFFQCFRVLEAENLGKTIKTIKTIIFKLSPDGGVAPGDSLKIMVFMVFIGFSNVLGSLCVIFIGFSNVCVFWKPKTLGKPIKTIMSRLEIV